MDRDRDGSTPARAILQDPNVWRRRNCPGFTVVMQELMRKDGKYFDALTLVSEDEDDVRVVYFDVSNLLGKSFEQMFVEAYRSVQRDEGDEGLRRMLLAERAEMMADRPMTDSRRQALEMLDRIEQELLGTPHAPDSPGGTTPEPPAKTVL